LSPDSLSLFGNSLGAAGRLLLLSLPIGVLIHLSTLHSFRQLNTISGDPVKGIQKVLGPRRATILLICGKLPFAVCTSAGLVVSAGFVFNEVFVYWFPNFAFAYLFLAIILFLNLFARKTALILQILALAGACSGMVFLSGAGLFSQSEVTSLSKTLADVDYRYLAAVVVVLVGFDMGLYADGPSQNGFSHVARSLVIALIGSGVVLLIWGLSAMAVVPPAKLESSTIPYMTMARKAFGQSGRYIMGMVVISGVFAAVNAIIYSVSTMTAQLAVAENKPERLVSLLDTRRVVLLFTAGASAMLMAMGYAGEPILETWIRASLVLWLAYYITVNIAAYRVVGHVHAPNSVGQTAAVVFMKAPAILGTALAAAGLILLESDPLAMLVFIVAITVTVTIVVIGIDLFVIRSAGGNPERPPVLSDHKLL
jgi:L-asparagine transporter-like permease